MKKLFIIFCTLVSLVACNGSFETVSYKTLSTVAVTVNTARLAYVDIYEQGKVPLNLKLSIETLYPKYQKAMNEAVDAARIYQAAKNLGKMTDPSQVNTAIFNAEVLVNDLLTLFTRAGIPSEPIKIQREK